MNDLCMFADRRMTVKEVAEALGVSSQCIRKWARGLFPESVQNGKQTMLDELQVTRIKQRIMNTNGHIGAITIVKGDGFRELVQYRRVSL